MKGSPKGKAGKHRKAKLNKVVFTMEWETGCLCYPCERAQYLVAVYRAVLNPTKGAKAQ